MPAVQGESAVPEALLRRTALDHGIGGCDKSRISPDSTRETVTAGRTCLTIAHRLSTVRHADMILVVKNGRIVEQGNHETLLKNRGYYSELNSHQYEEETTAKIFS